MKRIQALPPEIVSKIAAGEVIERPASVVKELVENSIDAGATRIEIEVEQAGSESIKIIDNGSGILQADLPLVFTNHATSKLKQIDDLFEIASLGFRGEAMSSIGGIAMVTLQSRPQPGLSNLENGDKEDTTGAEIHCNGGALSAITSWNGAYGTRIEVRHLFYNTPVRKKFLKTANTELGHIIEVVTRIALSHPGLHIVLRHNQKLVYEIPGNTDLIERVGFFFDREITDHLYAIDFRRGNNRVHGLIADPCVDKSNGKMQYFFVNGRWIRDRTLGAAVQEGYRGLLMQGKYAVAFLFVEMPADQLDVNVHPTKAEVRFRDSSSVFQLVRAAIREKLSEMELVPELRLEGQPMEGLDSSNRFAGTTLFNSHFSGIPDPPLPPVVNRRDTSNTDSPFFKTPEMTWNQNKQSDSISQSKMETPKDNPIAISPRQNLANHTTAPWEESSNNDTSLPQNPIGEKQHSPEIDQSLPPSSLASSTDLNHSPSITPLFQPRDNSPGNENALHLRTTFDSFLAPAHNQANSTANQSLESANQNLSSSTSPLQTDPASQSHSASNLAWPHLAGLKPARVLQIHDAFLVMETTDGMLVIDQHALHERILFEQLKKRVQNGNLEVQRLLIPEAVDLKPDQIGVVLEAKEALEEIGLDIEDFGGGTILISSYPAMLHRSSPSEIFLGVVEYLLNKEQVPSKEEMMNRLLATMACRAAVKAGDHLTPDEIHSLMEQRKLADDSHHCPHGRPTSLLFRRQDLEKQFRRT